MDKKDITVKIDVRAKNSKRKATFAVRELRRQVKKHFRAENFVLDNELNNFFWKEGKKQAPTKVSITGIKHKDKLYIFLANSKALKDFETKMKAPKEKKKKTEKKATETKKSVEPKKTTTKPKTSKPKKEDEKK